MYTQHAEKGAQLRHIVFEEKQGSKQATRTVGELALDGRVRPVKGTIAMAKLANDENSATSQWFFNMVDNSEALDTQNGGFTVFGQITAQSQATLDNIAGLVHCGDIPLVDITSEQCSSSDVALSSANFVTINSVVVLDDDPLSSANLNPTANTLISQDDSSAEAGSSSSSGGSMGGGFCLIALLGVGKRLKRAKY